MIQLNHPPRATRTAASSRRQRGQGMVEYFLGLLVILGVFVSIDRIAKNGTGKIWKFIAKQIAPGCPGCTPPDSLN